MKKNTKYIILIVLVVLNVLAYLSANPAFYAHYQPRHLSERQALELALAQSREEAELQEALALSRQSYRQEQLKQQEEADLQRAIKHSLRSSKRGNKENKNSNNHIAPTTTPSCGLVNWSGVNCYMNATLQCLAHSPLYRHGINNVHDASMQGSLANLLTTMGNSKTVVDPSAFAKKTTEKYFGEMFTHYQQDADEFLGGLLNDVSSLHKACSFDMKTVLECQECGTTRTKTERENKISLAIPSQQNTVTISDCLNNFFGAEWMVGDNAVFCSKCNRKTATQKKSTLGSEPETLIIQLKRFSMDWNGNVVVTNKNNVPVRLGKTSIELPTQGPVTPATYRLCGVALHNGNLNSGHYTALGRNSASGWSLYNDSVVSNGKSLLNHILTKGTCANGTPYLLFYERIQK